MREMCFRGKRVDNGEWVEGDYFERKDTAGKIIESVIIEDAYEQITSGQRYIRSNIGGECSRVDPATVGEFSGKCDKNDRRIFEGDIVDGLFRVGMPLRAVCAFNDGAFGLAWTHGGVDHFSAFTSICNVEYEVVGNIYDNPEMLEQEVQ